MINKKIKIGVVGLGYLGEFHVKHLSTLDTVEVIGVHDLDEETMKEISTKYSVPLAACLDTLLEKVDAVSIVTPTNYHADIALKAIEKNCHIFIEKPVSNSVKDANKILASVILNKKIAHVGHIERFNPAFMAFNNKKRSPLFIECHRLAEANNRSMDISVVLDLMIHDIDLVLQLINSPIDNIIADGVNIVSNSIDLANVKLIFKNGCVVNLTASRISNKNMRKMRIFETKSYSSLDLMKKEFVEYNAIINESTKKMTFKNTKHIIIENDALRQELKDFCDCIESKNISTTNLSYSIQALEIAKKINHIIQSKHK